VTERERTAINEALHELRRPLQALALCGGSGGDVVASSARLAAVALERLDREVNGGSGERPREPLRCEAPLRSAVRRWHARVALGGGSLELRWRAGEAVVVGDAAALEQAVDNLIVNAIEHGGPEIVVEGRRRAGLLVLSVADSGRGTSTPPGAGAAPGSAERIVLGGRRGHGLGLVRRFAASHGGRFVLHRADEGSVAILELPLAAGRLASGLAA
jgi:signal transduction histidine kinase